MTPDAWWTWNPDRPTELVNRAAGFRIQPVLFSASADRAWIPAAGPDLSFGPRRIGGGDIRFETRFAGTPITWTYATAPNGGARVSWEAGKGAEWGLRYWLAIAVEAPEGAMLHHDRATAEIRADGAAFSLRPAEPPALVTVHDSVEALADDLDAHGYFHLGTRGDAGRLLALRFNLEQAREGSLAISAPGSAPEPAAALAPEGAPQEALQAVHDVMAWNHVHDAVNDRPYTVLSRFWNTRKFGGFGVWLSDVLWNAMLWSLFDPRPARENFEAVAAWQTEAGNFPCLVTGADAWLDRSQIPTAAWVAWQVHARGGGEEFLASAYSAAARNHDWWRRRRALGDTGFVTYGTSIEVGDGLYKGTRFAAQNESSMDNSPMHEEAVFDRESGLLLTADVGLNSLFALDAEMLGHIALALGRMDEAEERFAEHAELARLISERLWDDKRQVFANRLPDGRFVTALTPTSFYPMAAGAATAAQARTLHDRHIAAPDKFGGELGLPSVTRDHPAFHDNCYWRGRVWAPMNYWTHVGLRRAGLAREAAELARRGWRGFEIGWRRRLCGENHHPDTGEIHDQPDSDGFYSWGALFPSIVVDEVVAVDPWGGLRLAPSGAGREFGPTRTPLGALHIRAHDGEWLVLRDGAPFLSGTVAGAFGGVEATGREIRLTAPEGPDGEWFAPAAGVVGVDAPDGIARLQAGRITLRARDRAVRIAIRLADSDPR